MLAAILGQSATGIPKGLDAAEETRQRQQQLDELKAHRDASLGLQEREFDAAQRHREATQAAQFIDHPAIGKVHRDLAPVLLRDRLEREQEQQKRADDDARTGRFADHVQDINAKKIGVEGFGDVGATAEPPTVQRDPGMVELAKRLRFQPYAEAVKAANEHFKPREPKAPIQYDTTKELRDAYDPTKVISPAAPRPAKPNLSQRLEDILHENGINPATATPADIGKARKMAFDEEMKLAAARETMKTQPLPAGEAATDADLRTADNLLGSVDTGFKPSYAGPIAGRLGALRNLTGIGASREEATHRAQLAEVSNALLRAQSGMAVTPQEYERIKQELPQTTDPPVVFKAKLAAARKLIQDKLAARAAEFNQRGFRGSPPPPASAPAAPPAPQQLPAGTKMENGELVSQSGKYVWRGGQWQPR